MTEISLFAPWLALLIPALYLLAYGYCGATVRPLQDSWRFAQLVSGCVFVCSLLIAVAIGITPADMNQSRLARWISVNALTGTGLILVSFIAWAIIRFSQRYLDGDTFEHYYLGWIHIALAGVMLVIISNDLVLLGIGWVTTSLAMNKLLLIYSDRSAAKIAAHKKFLISRFADICFFGATILLALEFRSTCISTIVGQVAADTGNPSLSVVIASLLIAMTAILKCAQLPFHGWLIQVMEAPTPVSALMHAGVVNLGGFVLIRLSPMLSEVDAAQTLLVLVGSLTAVICSLVMMTRISIKVSLAWSTCAQMGFMLMQCGLGAYDLALLHLIAHSLYKAHSFLSSGGAVIQSNIARMTPAIARPSLLVSTASAVVAATAVYIASQFWNIDLLGDPALWVLASIFCLALVPVIVPIIVPVLTLSGDANLHVKKAPRTLAIALVTIAALPLIYLGLHLVLAHWVPVTSANSKVYQVVWVVLCFTTLFVLQTLILRSPKGALAVALYPWFYAGLFLDYWFTRSAFYWWPMRPTGESGGNQSTNHDFRGEQK